MIPEEALDLIRRWSDHKVPEHVREQMRLELDVTDRTVTIVECRRPWRPDDGPDRTGFPIARLRYRKSRDDWALYWRDRNLGFHEYDLADPSAEVQGLLDEVDGKQQGTRISSR